MYPQEQTVPQSNQPHMDVDDDEIQYLPGHAPNAQGNIGNAGIGGNNNGANVGTGAGINNSMPTGVYGQQAHDPPPTFMPHLEPCLPPNHVHIDKDMKSVTVNTDLHLGNAVVTEQCQSVFIGGSMQSESRNDHQGADGAKTTISLANLVMPARIFTQVLNVVERKNAAGPQQH